MSHNLDMKTCMTDEVALAKALPHLGFTQSEIAVHDKPVAMKNWQGNIMEEKASVIVDYTAATRVGSYPSNAIGFFKDKDGTFKVHMDDGFIERNPDFIKKLGTYYNYEKSKIELEARKIKYEEKIDETGRLQLRCVFKKQKKSTTINL